MINYKLYTCYEDFIHDHGTKRLAVYGVSEKARGIGQSIKSGGGEIAFFIDYDNYPESRVGKQLDGVSVRSLREAEGGTVDVIVLSSWQGYTDVVLRRISRQLGLGVVVVQIDEAENKWNIQNHNHKQNRLIVGHDEMGQLVERELKKLQIDIAVCEDIYRDVRPYSMTGKSLIYFIMLGVLTSIRDRHGDILAELGVHKGGSSLAALMIQRAVFGRVVQPIHMFDAFTHFPNLSPEDQKGASFLDHQVNTAQRKGEKHYPDKWENRTYVAEVNELFKYYGFYEGDYFIHQGWFEDTLEPFANECRELGKKISFLRLDGDIYKSIMISMEHTIPIVADGGLVMIDDYQLYGGCSIAVHEYLGVNKLPYKLQNLNMLTFFYKTDEPLFGHA